MKLISAVMLIAVMVAMAVAALAFKPLTSAKRTQVAIVGTSPPQADLQTASTESAAALSFENQKNITHTASVKTAMTNEQEVKEVANCARNGSPDFQAASTLTPTGHAALARGYPLRC
jgi:uncharacterized protein YpmB